MKGSASAFLLVSLLLTSCSASNTEAPNKLSLDGRWIVEPDGQVMLDPQTSGLVRWRDKLLTVSDGSAHPSQQRKLAKIDPQSTTLSSERMVITMTDNVLKSCFALYLGEKPDYEALVVDPDDDKVFYLVTEDASRSGGISGACAKRYKHTGSTDYPTLLVRLELKGDALLMTHVRPLQFAPEFKVGDYPNDGIEGMAMSPERMLYLALEKDMVGNPRIFSLLIDEEFWQNQDFASVSDPQLKTPAFDRGNHPINGMDYYITATGQSYLVAAARNDDEIWFIDLAKKRETIVVPLQFMAQVDSPDTSCPEWELMDNASIEGIAVDGESLWLINDPWKKNYLKNIQCNANEQRYKKMAPLLFKMPINPDWFAASQ